MKKILLLCYFFMLPSTLCFAATVVVKPLLPGLLLGTLNPHLMETGDSQFGLEIGRLNGSMVFEDDFSYTNTGESTGFEWDSQVEKDILVGLGYENDKLIRESESISLGGNTSYKVIIEWEEKRISAGGHYLLSDEMILGTLVRRVENIYAVNFQFSQGSRSATLSGSGSVDYLDFVLGGTYKIDDNLALGAMVIPGATRIGELTGDVTGEFSAGHGLILEMGAAYHQDEWVVGADLFYRQEEVTILDGQQTGLLLTGSYLVDKNFSLTADINRYTIAIVKDSTGYISPKYEWNEYGLSLDYLSDGFLLSVGYQKQSGQYEDSDPDSIDVKSQENSLTEFSFIYGF